jgi:hypothetical protein
VARRSRFSAGVQPGRARFRATLQTGLPVREALFRAHPPSFRTGLRGFERERAALLPQGAEFSAPQSVHQPSFGNPSLAPAAAGATRA